MNCPTLELLSAYVDEEISPAQSRSMGVHLGQCGSCLRSVRLLRAMKVRMASLPTPAMPKEITAKLVALIEENNHGSKPPDFSVWRRMSRRVYAWGACAAVAIACACWFQCDREASPEVPVAWLLAEH